MKIEAARRTYDEDGVVLLAFPDGVLPEAVAAFRRAIEAPGAGEVVLVGDRAGFVGVRLGAYPCVRVVKGARHAVRTAWPAGRVEAGVVTDVAFHFPNGQGQALRRRLVRPFRVEAGDALACLIDLRRGEWS